jgi:RNA polymerase sigma-70 factor (ECF subfamily)
VRGTPDEPAIPTSPGVVETLVREHQRFLRFLLPRVGSREVAEEILQAAFVKGIEKGGTIRDGETAVAWFYRLLRNAVIDHYRHRGAEGSALARYARETEAEVDEMRSDLEGAVCECVKALVSTLKPEYAGAIERVDLEGMTVAAAAAEAGITANNAAVRLHRARAALRRRLEQTCGTCAEHGCLACTCKMGGDKDE